MVEDLRIDAAIAATEHCFLRAEDGRFVDFWTHEDGMGRMYQLGCLPSRSSRSGES